tara:strand:+ start:5201 stop:5326 length:126 start_codon:yes stop_codon:yes gene_type:complete
MEQITILDSRGSKVRVVNDTKIGIIDVSDLAKDVYFFTSTN